jgi:hypothetical protein
VIVSRKGHLTAESALLVKPYTPSLEMSRFLYLRFSQP